MGIYNTVNVNIQKGHLVDVIEVELDKIYWKESKLFIQDIPYNIIIMGDEFNIPKAFTPDYGDGFPRIICDYFGIEHDWFLDDIILIPLNA